MTEEELNRMSDEELEQAFLSAKAEGETAPEDETYEDDVDDTEDFVEDEYEDEAEDELEQPNEDSDDDDASSEDDVDEDESEDSDSEEGNLDGDDDQEDEQSEDNDDDAEDEEQPTGDFKFKANGREYEFTKEEMFEKFPSMFGQAMDYTKKMQAIKPWRQTIDALESAELSHKDVNLMIDVLKGDKDAISEVIKKAGIDAMELDTENSQYAPKDYGRDEETLALKDVIDTISSDTEYEVTQRVLGKEWDENSWSTLSKQPHMIKALHEDVKSGMYDKLQPIAEKLKLYNGGGKSDLEYYGEAAAQYFAQEKQRQSAETDRLAKAQEAEKQAEDKERIAAVKDNERKSKATREKARSRRAATPTKKGTSKNKVVDYLDIEDEEWDDWYNKTMENQV